MIVVRISDWLTKTLMVLAAFWAFVLCFFILAEIISRALNMPLQGTKEIIANSVVMIVFLQLGFAIRSRSMLSADFLVDAFGPRMRRAVVALGYILGIVFFVILANSAIGPALRSFANGEFDGEGALRVPVWPARFMIVGGAALAAVNYAILAAVEIFDLHVQEPAL